MHKLMQLKFCIVFPRQRYIPAWTHDVISHSSDAKQQQSLLCMVLYIAYSDAGQFIACMCQISLVYVSLRKRYESTLSYFWLTLVFDQYFLIFEGCWTWTFSSIRNAEGCLICVICNKSFHSLIIKLCDIKGVHLLFYAQLYFRIVKLRYYYVYTTFAIAMLALFNL